MAAVGRRMYERGFVIATDGNLSIRLGPHRFLVTRSGVCKGSLTTMDMVVCDDYGRIVRGHKVSSETLLHLAAYYLRPDINAVIHAHPPLAIAFTLADKNLAESRLPEVVMSLGSIPTAMFAAPSSPEGAEVIRDLIIKHDALILDRHGSLTVGKDLTDAYYKLERLEFAAQVTLAAVSLGEIKGLSPEEIRKIEKSIEFNRSCSLPRCPSCGEPLHLSKSVFCSQSGTESSIKADTERLANLVQQIIKEGRM